MRVITFLLVALLTVGTVFLGPPRLRGGQGDAKGQKTAKQRHIVAFGGAGTGSVDGVPVMMKYVLDLSGKPKPRVCFMPTATGDSKSSIDSFMTTMKKLDCETRVQKMFIASPQLKSFEDELLQADVIYVGGGNTLNAIAIWRAQGVDKILRQAWERGIVLAGTSAGSICWFEQGSTDSRPGKLTAMDCLGFLKGSNCPHYDGEKQRKPTYHQMILKGEIKDGLAADNGVGLHFVGEKLEKVISIRPKAKAYRVYRDGDKVVEEVLKVEYLGK